MGHGITPRDFFDIMGMEHEIEVDRAAGGDAFKVEV